MAIPQLVLNTDTFAQWLAKTNDLIDVTVKHNLISVTTPSVSDDSTINYEIGSKWIDNSTTPSTQYVCFDASVDGAEWHNVTHLISHNNLLDVNVNEHIDWISDQGGTNIHSGNYTNTTYVSGDFTHDNLSGFVANEHIDWSSTNAKNIHTDNYTNTTYSVGDGGLTQRNFTTALKGKLDSLDVRTSGTLTDGVSVVGGGVYGIKTSETFTTPVTLTDIAIDSSIKFRLFSGSLADYPVQFNLPATHTLHGNADWLSWAFNGASTIEFFKVDTTAWSYALGSLTTEIV